jgi:hypothetical protein
LSKAPFTAHLLIAVGRPAPLLLRRFGAGFAHRVARACRLPVLLLPEERPARHLLGGRPCLLHRDRILRS